MRKRFVSLVTALVLAALLVPPAFAAVGVVNPTTPMMTDYSASAVGVVTPTDPT